MTTEVLVMYAELRIAVPIFSRSQTSMRLANPAEKVGVNGCPSYSRKSNSADMPGSGDMS